MSDKLIMTFKVYADPAEISNMECAFGAVTFIPFKATVRSDLFTGETLPGACDVQVENPAKCRHLCAKYMFKGEDSAGNKCMLFVENNGFVSSGANEGGCLKAFPSFMTDSPVLGEYLSQQRFRSEVEGTPDGIDIRIYDVVN
ncbi:MAG: DUF3237 domain-containing protein [Lachnospiraceae bacterium]|nr:DUF3237 domain-containing protein [Lachnospiraceae bacterium]